MIMKDPSHFDFFLPMCSLSTTASSHWTFFSLLGLCSFSTSGFCGKNNALRHNAHPRNGYSLVEREANIG